MSQSVNRCRNWLMLLIILFVPAAVFGQVASDVTEGIERPDEATEVAPAPDVSVEKTESTEATQSAPAPSRRQVDKLELDITSVTGNQELPKVLYIVPWKESGLVDLAGKPLNSLLDEVLAPLDREVFKRQVSYFDQLHTEKSAVTPEK